MQLKHLFILSLLQSLLLMFPWHVKHTYSFYTPLPCGFNLDVYIAWLSIYFYALIKNCPTLSPCFQYFCYFYCTIFHNSIMFIQLIYQILLWRFKIHIRYNNLYLFLDFYLIVFIYLIFQCFFNSLSTIFFCIIRYHSSYSINLKLLIQLEFTQYSISPSIY